MNSTQFSIKHPVIIIILLVALTLFGLVGTTTMNQEFFAQVSVPELIVITVYPGAGAEDVEREVSSVIEDSIASISGISDIKSASYDSFSMLNIQFNYNEDIAKKITDVRERITDAQNDLPNGTEIPQILESSSSALPIFTFSIESELDPLSLDEYIEKTLIPQLSRIEGVALNSRMGNSQQHVSVTVRHEDLATLGIDLLTVYGILQANNSSIPVGQVRFQEEILTVRMDGQYHNLDDIKNIVVSQKNNSPIHLYDIADVTYTQQRGNFYVTKADSQIQIINVLKQEGSDTIKVASDIKKELKYLEKESNNLVSFTVINDDSYNISLAINSLRNSALLGGVLAVFVIFLFLHNIRSTVIIAVSLPCSVLFAFCFMAIKGQGINLMTLSGLTVAVGMIVDNSIVVLENIYRHYVQTQDAKKAALIGTKEVSPSIIASTTTTLVVFIPLLFLDGLTGIVLADIAYTIIWAVGSSLIAALIVVPFLSAYVLRPVPLSKYAIKSVLILHLDTNYKKIEKLYTTILKKSLANRKFVVFFAILLLVISVLSAGMLGFEFLAESDMNEIQIKATFPATYNLEQTRDAMKELDLFVRSIVPEIETTAFTSGAFDIFAYLQQPNKGFARIKLLPTAQRNRSVFEIVTQLRSEIPEQFIGIDASIENGGLTQLLNVATGGGGLVIEVSGSSIQDLYHTAQEFTKVIEKDVAVDKVTIDTNFDRRELLATIQKDIANTLGIQTQSVTAINRILFSGLEAGFLRTGGNSYPIVIKSDITNAPVTESVFNNIFISNAMGSQLPLSTILEVSTKNTVNQIIKKNKVPTITIQSQLNTPDLRSIQTRILPLLEKIELSPGVSWQVGGSAAFMQDSFISLALLMCISIFLVYMVMVIQFEKFIQPLIVMVSIPFAFIGTVFSLTVFNTSLSILSMLGIITLVGTVVNTAIILIDYINLMRTDYHMDLYEAIITGCKNRLRPVLMSVLTTAIGLIPMIFAIGEGSDLSAPLARAIFGGLLSSTFVTLILVPVLYDSLEQRNSK